MASSSTLQNVSLRTSDGYDLVAKVPSTWRRDTPKNPDALGQWNLDPGYFEDANIIVAGIKLDDALNACKPMPLPPQNLAMCSPPVQVFGLQAITSAQLECWKSEFSPETRVTLTARGGALSAGNAVTLALAGSLAPPEEDLPPTQGYSLVAGIVAADFKDDVAKRVFFVKALGPAAFMERNSVDLMAFVDSLSKSCR